MAGHARFFRVGEEVGAALSGHRRVVALESTIFSRLGLPSPANRECFERCAAAVRDGGAVPALTAVIDGVAVVGVEAADLDRVLAGANKVAARDLAHAVSGGLDVGVTTVSAALTLAARAGIEVFATGGIGGVHRGVEVSGDVSGDLVALSRHPVVTVSSGAKAFLDLARTLEYLESLGVPVVGWRTDRFPAFYVRDSGLEVPTVVDDGDEVAAMLRGAASVGHRCGLLVVNPISESAELDPEQINDALDSALALIEQRGLRGPEVTPVLLDAIAAATDGLSVNANLALAQGNARVAAEIAAALARYPSSVSPR